MDLRSQSERAREQAARSPLDGKHEALASQICQLIQTDSRDEIVRIGQELFAEGDRKLMQLVHYRVIALCGRSPSSYWNGVGKWQH